MHLSSETHAIMDALAAYVKHPDERPDLPGVNAARLGEYRRLVRNVFDGTLRQAYPLTAELLPSEEWDSLIDSFMAEHPAQSYQIWKMPYEFYEFVLHKNVARKFNRPYLNDLLYFEWIEIEVFTMPDATLPPFQAEGDFLTHRLVPNPDYRLIELQYPIFKMSAEQALQNKGRYFLLVFRQIESGVVRFVEVTPFLALLWQTLNEMPLSGYEALQKLKEAVGAETIEPLIQITLPFYKDMFVQGGILGFQKMLI